MPVFSIAPLITRNLIALIALGERSQPYQAEYEHKFDREPDVLINF